MRQEGGEQETRWRRIGNKMEENRRQDGGEQETRWRRIGDKMEENMRQDGGEQETRWRRIGDKMEENRRHNREEKKQEECAKLILTENGEKLKESERFGKMEKWRLNEELRRSNE